MICPARPESGAAVQPCLRDQMPCFKPIHDDRSVVSDVRLGPQKPYLLTLRPTQRLGRLARSRNKKMLYLQVSHT